MSARLRLLQRLWLILAIALVAAVLPAAAAPLAQKDADTLAALVKYIDAGNEEMTVRLAELGYQPTVDLATWRAFPSVRKVEAAYASAAKVGGDTEGGLLLAQLAHHVAGESEAAQRDPYLKDLLAAPKPKGQVRFAVLTLAPDQIRLDSAIKAKIRAIVDYADGGILNGASGILQYEMGLDPDVAYDILRAARTNTEALIAGLQRAGLPPPQAVRLAEIATEIAKMSEAAGADERLKAIVRDVAHMVDPKFLATARSLFGDLPDAAPGSFAKGQPLAAATVKQLTAIDPDKGLYWSPLPPSAPPPALPTNPGSPNPLGPGDGAGSGSAAVPSLQGSAKRYKTFSEKSYGSQLPGFIPAVKMRGGFGGVIYGAPVKSESGMPRPASVVWEPFSPKQRPDEGTAKVDCSKRAGCDGWGRLLLRFVDGREALTPIFRAEDVYAARCIAYSGCQRGDVAAVPGQAIPLAGLTRIRPDVAVVHGELSSGSWFETLVHPALDGTPLGRAAIALDGLPTSEMNAGVLRLASDAGEEDAIETWLDDVGGTWKFTDLPMVVGSVGRRLTVRPEALAATTSPEEMARASFIGFVNFSGDEDDADDASVSKEFDAAIGPLLRTVAEVERLNDFAQVLGIVRWAKSQGATFARPPVVAPPDSTIGSVTFNAGSISLSPSASPVLHAEVMRGSIESFILSASAKLPPASRAVANRALETSREAYVTALLQEDVKEGIAAAISSIKPATRDALAQTLSDALSVQASVDRRPTPSTGQSESLSESDVSGTIFTKLATSLKADGLSDAQIADLKAMLSRYVALLKRASDQNGRLETLINNLDAGRTGATPEVDAAISSVSRGLMIMGNPELGTL